MHGTCSALALRSSSSCCRWCCSIHLRLSPLAPVGWGALGRGAASLASPLPVLQLAFSGPMGMGCDCKRAEPCMVRGKVLLFWRPKTDLVQQLRLNRLLVAHKSSQQNE
eukprot:757578-Pelagomonas_calceolata.AAC.1